MNGVIERLHTIRAHLRTGALGQREVWEDWLTEAGSEIERLQEEGTVELAKALLEIERLREENKFLRNLVADELRALEPKP